MIIDQSRMKEDESKSNPMAVAFAYPDCPMPEKRPCFWIVVGSGRETEVCPHVKPVGDQAECTFTTGG